MSTRNVVATSSARLATPCPFASEKSSTPGTAVRPTTAAVCTLASTAGYPARNPIRRRGRAGGAISCRIVSKIEWI